MTLFSRRTRKTRKNAKNAENAKKAKNAENAKHAKHAKKREKTRKTRKKSEKTRKNAKKREETRKTRKTRKKGEPRETTFTGIARRIRPPTKLRAFEVRSSEFLLMSMMAETSALKVRKTDDELVPHLSNSGYNCAVSPDLPPVSADISRWRVKLAGTD